MPVRCESLLLRCHFVYDRKWIALSRGGFGLARAQLSQIVTVGVPEFGSAEAYGRLPMLKSRKVEVMRANRTFKVPCPIAQVERGLKF